MTRGRVRFDSAQAAPRRPSPLARTLFYEAGDLSIDVMLQDGGAQLQIVHGQVVRSSRGTAVAGAAVRIGEERLRTDEHGQFAVTLLGRGHPISFTVDTPEDGTVTIALPGEESACA